VQKAIFEYKRAIHIKQDYLLAYNDLGIALSDLNQHTEAIAVLETAVQLKSQNPVTLYNLGYAYTFAGQHKKAVNAFKKTIALNPEFGESHFYLAILHLTNKDRKGAFEQYSQLKKLNLKLAAKLYQVLYSDKLVVVDDK
jgi:tetratricopeptide (TPR) repeat protein